MTRRAEPDVVVFPLEALAAHLTYWGIDKIKQITNEVLRPEIVRGIQRPYIV